MLLFPNGLCIKESHHTNLHCSRGSKILYMLRITTKCVKSQKITFLNKEL